MKYIYLNLVELIVWPFNAKIAGDMTPKESSEAVIKYLDDGWEILQAIPFSTSTTAGIKYVFRKEKNEKVS